MYPLARPFLFGLDAETAHGLGLKALDLAYRTGTTPLVARPITPMPTKVMGLTFPNPVGLVGLIQKNHAFWKIRPDQKIVVSGDWPTTEERLKVAERITADLARVAGA